MVRDLRILLCILGENLCKTSPRFLIFSDRLANSTRAKKQHINRDREQHQKVDMLSPVIEVDKSWQPYLSNNLATCFTFAGLKSLA